MKSAIWFLVLAVAAFNFCEAQAAIVVEVTGDTGDAPAGWVSNDVTVNSNLDLLSAAVFITLESGTVYNNNALIPGLETFQQSPGDTYVTLNGNPNTSIAGSAGDFGHNPLVQGEAEFGPTVLGVTWFSTTTDDVGLDMLFGTFSFSEDASGAGILRVSSQNVTPSQDTIVLIIDVTVENGVLTPEPTSLGLLSLGGLALLRRRK